MDIAWKEKNLGWLADSRTWFDKSSGRTAIFRSVATRVSTMIANMHIGKKKKTPNVAFIKKKCEFKITRFV